MTAAVLILTENDDLLDDLLRLCAAAGAEAEVVHGGTVPAARWERAPLILAGDDWAAARSADGGPPPRRSGVLLLGRDPDDHTVWARGVAIGAELVLHLPADERTLADRIADAVEGRGRPALTIGVLGGRGGAGASTLAAALAVTAAREGHATVLIDADPLGGGLDLLLGAERMPGLRWPAFTAARGRLAGAALTQALPRCHGLTLLSWDRAAPARLSAEAMGAVLGAARRQGGVVVIDIPRAPDEAGRAALAQLDLGLLVVPAELRAVAAARRVADACGVLARDLRLVARGAAGVLGGPELARLLALPLVGEMPEEAGLAAACDAGEPPGGDRRGALAGFCARLLRHARPPAGPGPVAAPPAAGSRSAERAAGSATAAPAGESRAAGSVTAPDAVGSAPRAAGGPPGPPPAVARSAPSAAPPAAVPSWAVPYPVPRPSSGPCPAPPFPAAPGPPPVAPCPAAAPSQPPPAVPPAAARGASAREAA